MSVLDLIGLQRIFHDGKEMFRRKNLNFIGGTVTDNPKTDSTDISIGEGGSGGGLKYTWTVDDYDDLATVTPVPGPGDEGKLALVRYGGTDYWGNTILDNSTFYYVEEVSEPTAGHLWRNMTTLDVDARVSALEEAGPGGSGDVKGPASSTDNAVARFDLATGKLIQSSNVTIDDSGNIVTPGMVDGVDVSALAATVNGKASNRAQATDSSGGSFTSGVEGDISFGTEVFDPNNNFASNVYTVPVTGVYSITVSVFVPAPAAVPSSALVAPAINGTRINPGETRALIAGLPQWMQVTTLRSLTAGQTVGGRFMQTTGSTMSLSSSQLDIYRIA